MNEGFGQLSTERSPFLTQHIIPSPPPQRTAVTANHSHPYIYKTPSHLPLFPQACKREEEELTNPSSSSLLPSSGGGAAPARLSRRPPPTMEMKKIACAVLVAAASATAAFAAEAPAPSPASDSFAVAPAVGAQCAQLKTCGTRGPLTASDPDALTQVLTVVHYHRSLPRGPLHRQARALRQNGFVSFLFDLLRTRSLRLFWRIGGDELEWGTELRLLARHMENRMVIAKCGAISLLVGLLHSTDPKTQENAVTALLNLSLSDNKIAIANANAIDPLIHVLKTGNPEAQENSAATLLSLSVTEENKLQIGRSGAIEPLVELLANGTLRGKKDAVSALYNLSNLRENKVRIVQAGAVTLLQLCQNSGRFCSLVLQEGAVPPLVALSRFGTPRAKTKINKDGMLEFGYRAYTGLRPAWDMSLLFSSK
ncbi:hypothetical protein B296_00018687 [Ensete ventricosum]|uniref:Armadillo repeat-containing domain-containing protein n=1 Tax=Ensete ventricosum TaxID=4639 RepID=A0A427ATA6_ENSVE|nr:hypothetical protein B296_00018687 [Ensete ventricosum]